MCETIGPFPTSDYYYFILFKYHHWQNPMQDIVPKPTPNCFAVLLSFGEKKWNVNYKEGTFGAENNITWKWALSAVDH